MRGHSGARKLGCAGLLLAWPSLLGCGVLGGQSSDDEGRCPFESRALESDSTVSTLGFSAQDVLGWALDDRTVTATWATSSWGGIATNAPDGPTEMTLRLRRDDGAASEETACGETHVVMPVVIDASTADGLFELQAPARLLSQREGFATLRKELRFGDLTGEFAWESSEGDAELVRPQVRLWLSPSGASGSFSATLSITTSSGDVSPPSPPDAEGLLVWPASSPCSVDQVPIVVAQADPTWSEGPARLNEATWVERGGASDGAPVSLSLSTDAALCESAWEPPRLPARLAVRTEDGAVDRTVVGHVLLDGDAVTFTNEHVDRWYAPREYPELDDFGIDLSPYESVALVVEVSVSDGGATGGVQLEGAIDDCESVCDERGCSGCPGLRHEVVFERELVGTE